MSITVIGAGPGDAKALTQEALEAIAQAEVVFAAQRHAALAGRTVRPLEPLSEALESISQLLAAGRPVAVLVSGDPGLYSLLGLLVRRFGEAVTRVIPGVSALQSLAAKLRESWQGAHVASAHGRALTPSALAHLVRTHEKTALFLDGERDPVWMARSLLAAGLDGVDIAVGEHLSYPDERLVRGDAAFIAAQRFGPLCLARVLNPHPQTGLPPVGLDDGAFLRGNVPMTKREVRMLALAELRLTPQSVVWDVGAGTGSVSVECARQCPLGQVYAVEREEDALALIARNRDQFRLLNLEVVPGTAPAALSGLPQPSHVFVGGGGAALAHILEAIEAMPGPLRLVGAAVTLESQATLVSRLSGPGWSGLHAMQLAATRIEQVGTLNMMRAQNPVTLVSGDWRGREE